MKVKDKIINFLEKYYNEKKVESILDENSVEDISELGGIGSRGLTGTPTVQQTKITIPEPRKIETPGFEKVTKSLPINMIMTSEDDNKPVRIKMEPGELGLCLDEPIEKFKNQIISGKKPWDILSKQLNTLYIYNMNKHPDIASKAKHKREVLATWVDNKRKENSEFGK